MSGSYTKFDPLEYLTNEEQIEIYLAVAKEVNDPIIYEQACAVAERAKKKLSSNQFKPYTVLQNQKNE